MSRLFERLIALCALWAFAAFGQGNFQLRNSYLNNNMNGNGKSITNLASIIATNFYGDGSGLTNILATDVDAAGVSNELQFRKAGSLGAATNWLYDLTDGSIKTPVETGLKFPTQTNAPFFLSVKSALFNSVRDNMLIIGYNQKQTNSAVVYTREDTNDIWWRLDWENRLRVSTNYDQSEFNLDWGRNDTGPDFRPLQHFIVWPGQTNLPAGVPPGPAWWFSSSLFAIVRTNYPYIDYTYPIFYANNSGQSAFNTNSPDASTVIDVVPPPSGWSANQQAIFRSTPSLHNGILFSSAGVNALTDNAAWGLFGGPNNYLTPATKAVELYFGSQVPSFSLVWSPSNVAAGYSSPATNAWQVLPNGNVNQRGQLNVNSLSVTNAISANSATISNLTASQFVATDGSKNLVTSASSAALAATLTDETGTGLAVFSIAPSMTNVVLKGTVGVNTNSPNANAALDVQHSAPSTVNQQAVLRSGTATHSGLIFSSVNVDPLTDTNAFGIFGGPNNYLTPASKAVEVYLGSGVPSFNIVWSPGNMNSGYSTPATNVFSATVAGVTIPNKLVSYNGTTLAGNGLASIVGSVNLTAQTATIGNTTIFTTPANSLYEVSGVVLDTSAGTAGTVTVTISWTDESGATTQTTGTLTLAALGRLQIGPWPISVTSGTAIQYSTTVTGALGSPQYALKIVLKRLQ